MIFPAGTTVREDGVTAFLDDFQWSSVRDTGIFCGVAHRTTITTGLRCRRPGSPGHGGRYGCNADLGVEPDSAVAMKYYLAALESEYVACGRSGAHHGVAVRDYGCTSRPTRPLESSLPPQ